MSEYKIAPPLRPGDTIGIIAPVSYTHLVVFAIAGLLVTRGLVQTRAQTIGAVLTSLAGAALIVLLIGTVRYLIAVSYTHLDVYKRQLDKWAGKRNAGFVCISNCMRDAGIRYAGESIGSVIVPPGQHLSLIHI